MNINKYFSFALLSVLLSACANTEKKAPLGGGGSNAVLEIAEEVDMGDFTEPDYKKSVDINFRNTGTDTLHIISAVPDCDCTEVEILDSTVAPNHEGRLRASLDLSEYPIDENRKRFFVMTNNREARAVYVTLIGNKK